MISTQKIQKSFDYGTLDHKWIVRNYLKKSGWTLEMIEKETLRDHDNEHEHEHQILPGNEPIHFIFLKLATSSFKYYYQYMDNINGDRSLKTVTSLCSDSIASLDVEANDNDVFHLSNVFNQIIKSTRKLYKCYDCGTNARAIFLKLIQTARIEKHGKSFITNNEQSRMSDEYLVNLTSPVAEADKCYRKIKSFMSDTVMIMSVSIQNFGHVWVIEKRFINGVVRYHHYQSSLRSHLILDHIEAMDYGRDPMKSIDIDDFFKDIKYLLGLNEFWSDNDHRLFAQLFKFLPSYTIDNPKPGFCSTWITYEADKNDLRDA